jgi:hypothetical protein
MRLSPRKPFGKQQFRVRAPLDTAANDNRAPRDRNLSLLIEADGGLARIAAKAERMSIAAAVAMAIGLFIGPVVFSCLMLAICNAALNNNGANHDHHDVGNQAGGPAGQAESG